MPKNRDLDPLDPLPANQWDALNEFLGTQSANLQVRLKPGAAGTLQIPAGSGNDQVALAVGGKWRFISAPVERANIGGSTRVLDLYAIAQDNVFVAGSPGEVDNTVYGFTLGLVENGAGAPAGAFTRKIAEVFWDAAAGAFTRIDPVRGGAVAPVPGTLMSGTIADRPSASAVVPGLVFADEFGTHWRSDGSAWALAGGTVPFVELTRSDVAVNSGALTQIAWDGEVNDGWAMHAANAAAIVFPYAGLWHVTLEGFISPLASETDVGGSLDFLSAGTSAADASNFSRSVPSLSLGSVQVVATRRVAAGDTVEGWVQHAAGVAKDFNGRMTAEMRSL